MENFENKTTEQLLDSLIYADVREAAGFSIFKALKQDSNNIVTDAVNKARRVVYAIWNYQDTNDEERDRFFHETFSALYDDTMEAVKQAIRDTSGSDAADLIDVCRWIDNNNLF